jgi:cell division protein FtsB
VAGAASATAAGGARRSAPARRAAARRSTTRRSSGGRSPGRPSFGLRPGRLILLVLLLAAVALYVGPLRAFFAQQDRYHEAVAALQAAQAENASLQKQAERLGTKSYIAQRAREDSLLVPPGTQAFVVKGLPGEEESGHVELPSDTPTTQSVTVLERIEDLWRTLLE